MSADQIDVLEQIGVRLDALAGLFAQLALLNEGHGDHHEVNTWWAAHHAVRHEIDAIDRIVDR